MKPQAIVARLVSVALALLAVASGTETMSSDENNGRALTWDASWNQGVQEPPNRGEYLNRWADMLRESMKMGGEALLKLVPVGCGIPQPLYMLDPSFSHGRITDQFKYQLSNSMEQNTINVMHYIYKTANAGSSKCQVLDMGANDGYYALLAGAYGCTVRSVEPQQLCYERLSMALGFNTLPGEVNLLRGAVGTTGTTLQIPRMDQCNGMFQASHSYSGPMRSRGAQYSEFDTVKMHTATSLADEGSKVTLWHVDVEGAEVDVIKSGADMLLEGRVEHLILELEGSRWPGMGVSDAEGIKTLKPLLANYHCRDLQDLKYVGSGHQFIEHFKNSGRSGEYWCFLDPAHKTAKVRRTFPCLPHGGTNRRMPLKKAKKGRRTDH
mmetsp:Transcript_10534/g.29985  ORF Transcript_10534/g.29985 Transcript_10534/m.29985 type:complete len:381 (+) Transcript_10534:190-1332(+)|eukprot:CAMPEP_0117682110 /NCGR_PEP_ID=MMETSP0804-20121206/19427_1 /TAXON_ID=1074897 /ORGANISM="Tetraselmis astigmatica, Strain CCMP880" /LENGTH=380 /DNA_ID=CAMNT_0005492085 /DNA_START=145 /DNA_END=1287 /DNA_ORIENTATION=+